MKIFTTYFLSNSSDNELDSKLELFKSINESSNSLTNIVEKYKDGLHQLSIETSNLGSFLRDCGKNSTSSKEIMCSSGKVICYVSTQVFTAMSSLNRTFQELNTFKLAVQDTRDTILVVSFDDLIFHDAMTNPIWYQIDGKGKNRVPVLVVFDENMQH